MARRGRSRSPFSLFSFQDIITCVSGIIILITLMLAIELSQRKQDSPQIATTNLVEKLREAIAEAQLEVARLDAELKQAATDTPEASGLSVDALQHDLFAVNEQIKSLEAEIASLRNQEVAVTKTDEKLQAKRFDREKQNAKKAAEELRAKDLDEQLRQVRKQNRLFYNSRSADGKQVWLIQIEANQVLVAPVGTQAPAKVFSQRFAMLRHAAFADWLTHRSANADFFFLLVRSEGTAEFANLRELLIKHRFTIGFDLLGPRQIAVDPEKGAAGL